MTDGNEINDDEFESLLDQLHGPGKVPGRVAGNPPSKMSSLPSSLTIREVTELGEQVQAWLTGESPIRVQLSAIEHIDTAGVQMLMAFQRSAEGMGLVCEWVEPSEPVSRIVSQLGVTSMRFSHASGS